MVNTMLSSIIGLLKLNRKTVKVRQAAHHRKWHIMFGHGLETAGVLLDTFEIGVIAKVVVFAGVSILCACTFLNLE